MSRTCARCKQSFDDAEFEHSSHPNRMCKTCSKCREQLNGYQRKWIDAHPEQSRALHRAGDKKWRDDNRDKVRATNRRYYEANREKVADRRRANRQAKATEETT